jgi:phosphoribosylaminoimidazole carboxylase PurE protein
MSAEDFAYCEQKALELFEFGQKVALEHGLILVDTKYEFGKDKEGKITLIDEIHTPDSSRYWIAETYQDRFDAGLSPESVDKEIVRKWYAEKCDPYKEKILPPAPAHLISTLSERYIFLYEKITGEKFDAGSTEERSYAGLRAQLKARGLMPRTKKVVIIMGSVTDLSHAESMINSLKKLKLSYELHAASAHKEPLKVLAILQQNENEKYDEGRYSHFVVYITIAGRSNALSGFVAGNSSFPTIACPPFKDKMDMLVNIHSTLQMPSNVPSLTVLEPDNAVLAAKRILDIADF